MIGAAGAVVACVAASKDATLARVALLSVLGFFLGLASFPLVWLEVAFASRSGLDGRDFPAFLLAVTCGLVGLWIGGVQAIYTSAMFEGRGLAHASGETSRFLEHVGHDAGDALLLFSYFAYASLPFGALVVARLRGLAVGRQCRVVARLMGVLFIVLVMACPVEDTLSPVFSFAALSAAAAGAALPLLTSWAERLEDRLDRRGA